jgi:hypothetical protein
MVKYLFTPCGLTALFFAPCRSFCIKDSTPFMAKNEDSTSVQLKIDESPRQHP